MLRKKAVSTALFLEVTICLSHPVPAQTAHDQNVLVVQGAKILPITSPPIEHGVLVVKGGKIVAVGEQGKVQIPAGAVVKDATGKIVMPGIVDSHSHIGIDANPSSSRRCASIMSRSAASPIASTRPTWVPSFAKNAAA